MKVSDTKTGKILTQHPQGKTGRNIDIGKYDQLKEAIILILKGNMLTHPELFNALRFKLKSGFKGSLDWYAETVKLDLEARKLIERTATKPQKYKLKGN